MTIKRKMIAKMLELIAIGVVGVICYCIGSGRSLISASFTPSKRKYPLDTNYVQYNKLDHYLSNQKYKEEYDYWYRKGQEAAEKDLKENPEKVRQIVKWYNERY